MKKMLFFLMLIFLMVELFAINEEVVDFEKEYEEYFKGRFGDESNRISRDVLEERCLKDLEQHLILQIDYKDLIDPIYYTKVADILIDVASEKSVQRIEKLIYLCDGIICELKSILESRYMSEEDDEGEVDDLIKYRSECRRMILKNDLGHYDELLERLSRAWLNTASRKVSERELALFYFSLLRKDRHVKIAAIGDVLDNIAKLGVSYRDEFYKILLSEAMDESYGQFDLYRLFKTPGYEPRKEELVKMIEGKKENLYKAACSWFQRMLPHDEYGQELAVKGLADLSNDRYYDSFEAIHNYLESPISDERKEYLFNKLNEYLIGLEVDYDKGIYLPSDDKNFPRSETIERIFAAIQRLMRPSANLNHFLMRKTKEIRHHLDWMQKRLKEAGWVDEKCCINVSINDYRQTLEEWEKQIREKKSPKE